MWVAFQTVSPPIVNLMLRHQISSQKTVSVKMSVYRFEKSSNSIIRMVVKRALAPIRISV
jgi:hypothetical protein